MWYVVSGVTIGCLGWQNARGPKTRWFTIIWTNCQHDEKIKIFWISYVKKKHDTNWYINFFILLLLLHFLSKLTLFSIVMLLLINIIHTLCLCIILCSLLGGTIFSYLSSYKFCMCKQSSMRWGPHWRSYATVCSQMKFIFLFKYLTENF